MENIFFGDLEGAYAPFASLGSVPVLALPLIQSSIRGFIPLSICFDLHIVLNYL